MIRRKKKPDCIRVNFVQSASSKRRRIKIKHVSYPINWTPSALHTPSPTCDLSGDGEEDSGGETERPVAAHLGSHRVRKEKAAEAWAEVRPKITSAIISSLGFQNGCVCVFCNSSPASIWCPDCASTAYFCEDCAIKLHGVINIFHSPLIWKASNTEFV